MPPIKALIGDAACDGPAQCHSIAIGAKSCGGPDAYLAWSSKGTDEAHLLALAMQHANARRLENRRAGMVSNCAWVADPGATCQAGNCRLSTGAGPTR
jgi:hypothetical protein